MELKELLIYRQQILDESKDADGYTSDEGFLENCLPGLGDTKHIESLDSTDIHCSLDGGSTKVNAYMVNESEERLQIFIVNEESIRPDATDESLMLSQKTVYEKQFNRAISFLKKSIKRQLDQLQDGSPAWILVHQLSSSGFMDQIDVVEIFLLTATVTVQRKVDSITVRNFEFEDENITVSFTRDKKKHTKDLIIIRRLIDINFLYNIYIAKGSRDPLIINFGESPFNNPLPCLRAANEAAFDSYLCAIPATLLAELYKRHSSRLLEKNVRSFLQLKGVNKGMQETIRNEPEKFIAYNNGLTITATDSDLLYKDGTYYIKTLTDFQIVNGGQTTATLYFSQKLGLNIDQIRVMAKINVAKGASEEVLDDLISNISTYSNAQSKVSKVDLRARNPQLMKIKSLSESILTISGRKWFFERAKGEYATLLRINSGKKAQLEKEFPKERRFSKEELAKYFAAWGDKPYAVKKGGEKIFRLFLEDLSGEGKSKKVTIINRGFYEELVARIVLFRELEKIYGTGNNAMGQLRSAVVPYSISVVYAYTNGNKKGLHFDLLKVWKAEKLDDDLRRVFKNLMELMNKLIKKYAQSDDLGEYSKKPELWDAIVTSNEISIFMANSDVDTVLKRYGITTDELRKREKEISQTEEINFDSLIEISAIFDRGIEFYKSILLAMSKSLSDSHQKKIESIIISIQQCKSIEGSLLIFEKKLLNEVMISDTSLLDKINSQHLLFSDATNFVIKKYNEAIIKGDNVQSSFDALKELGFKKGIRHYSVFGEIGKLLENGELPSMSQIRQVIEYSSNQNKK
ncbi:AIPR family protein [Chitinophaga oryziterrae]|nr:AIPR family protein [Chitinophaga oryziterrae]